MRAMCVCAHAMQVYQCVSMPCMLNVRANACVLVREHAMCCACVLVRMCQRVSMPCMRAAHMPIVRACVCAACVHVYAYVLGKCAGLTDTEQTTTDVQTQTDRQTDTRRTTTDSDTDLQTDRRT